MSKEDVYFYAAIVITITILQTIYNHAYMLYLQQIAQKIRIGLCSLIYRKALKLSTSSLINITSGKIVTLMTKDVALFDSAIILAHDLWIGIIQVIVMTYVMYKHIGVSAIFGVGFLILLIPFQLWIGSQTTKTRLKTAAKSDERIRLIQEVLTTIQIIKTYIWEEYFEKLVNYLRKSEILKLKIIFYLKAIMLSIGNMNSRISFFICIMTYSLLGNKITAAKAFIILSCYGSLRTVVTVAVPLGISQIADMLSAIERIKNFLLIEEVPKMLQPPPGLAIKIYAKNVYASIVKDKNVLLGVNLHLGAALYGLTGPVGCGKSSLLRLLLDDIILVDGNVEINGIISYASQEPWLFPGTIRQNILFGSAMDQDRYRTVIRVCGLRKDFENFPKYDNTLINDKGLNLSRGQQARINLARAIYKEADIYLLDSPLVALDINVGKYVFTNGIKKFLRGKLVILVTQQIHYLKEVDQVIIMKDGRIHKVEMFNELERSGEDLGFETQRQSEKEDEHEDYEFLYDSDAEYDENEETDLLSKSHTSLHEKAIKLYSESKQEGKVHSKVYMTYFKYAGGVKYVGLLLLLYIVAQFGATYFDFYVTQCLASFRIDIESSITAILDGHLVNYTLVKDDSSNLTYNSTIVEELDALSYQRSLVPLIYTTILLVTAGTVLGKSFLFFTLSSRSSRKLHGDCFSSVIKAPMAFFDTHLTGNILNRFSKDFATIDEFIPYIIYEFLRIFFIILGSISLIIKINISFLFVTFAFGVVLIIVRHYYLPTSRNLKRLDNITRSPVIGHLNASLEGVTTIRANEAQNVLSAQFDNHQDLHSSSAYMYLTTNRAFGFYLDMLCALYISFVTLTFIVFDSGTKASGVGLAITQAFGLTGLLQWGIRQWAELENQMTSVERILEYTNVAPEKIDGQEPTAWPTDGRIEYKDVYLRYSKTQGEVLKGISFTINPSEKVCIIGRTGAGKTSIISSLYRLYPIESGSIFIDNLNIDTVSIKLLRSKISIIPQNPILFSGTLRTNLDPHTEFSDENLWKVLELIEMKTTVEQMEGCLECVISEGGANFSIGERQLFCLARALLRRNKIVILDEPTANVDTRTDNLMHKTIRSQFSDCTILTIAHRLNSVLIADKVMVIDDGALVEFDSPATLRKNTESIFYKLISMGDWEVS
ncbi:atp-binding cassette sub-family c [Holotrichia oblita]|uniref:Atp-binding cassette sub-family c n=1 Tax=Holotrichia oblita TaxID=644536 RepID=A0ACB9TDP5_HOLOL|nr:atp-binding cassette sub-family c [Holotrichia oblita]